jgi:hypothetical protein
VGAVEVSRAAQFIAAALFAVSLAGCDQLSTVRFYNLTGAPISLQIGKPAPNVEPVEAGARVRAGGSKRYIAGVLLDAPITIRGSDCTYGYRPITHSDSQIDTYYGHDNVLDVRPDFGIYLRGWRVMPLTWKPADRQPPNWPLKPLSKTCR